MCGRVRLSSDVSEIKLVFSIPPHRPTPNYPPSWNVAPTDQLPVVRYDRKAGERSLDMLRWGLVPYWAKDLKVGFANINAKAEGIETRPAKALIHLGLTPGNAVKLAEATGVSGEKLQALAEKTAGGGQPSTEEINVLGQFDVILSAVLDDAYERADQKYRNASKLLAMAVATVLGGIGGWLVFHHSIAGSSRPAWVK
jgi:SOS response associated peptidase (SRAP)